MVPVEIFGGGRRGPAGLTLFGRGVLRQVWFWTVKGGQTVWFFGRGEEPSPWMRGLGGVPWDAWGPGRVSGSGASGSGASGSGPRVQAPWVQECAADFGFSLRRASAPCARFDAAGRPWCCVAVGRRDELLGRRLRRCARRAWPQRGSTTFRRPGAWPRRARGVAAAGCGAHGQRDVASRGAQCARRAPQRPRELDAWTAPARHHRHRRPFARRFYGAHPGCVPNRAAPGVRCAGLCRRRAARSLSGCQVFAAVTG